MRRTLLSLAAGLLLLAPLTILAADDSDAGQRTLRGEYIWDNGSEGPLRAVFTPTGDATWDVSFYFTFRGRNHTYTGTAEGSLSKGALKGTVKNENKRRTFTFEGNFQDGVFEGTHAEIYNNRSIDTGTLTLG